jgi:hypothetical protein
MHGKWVAVAGLVCGFGTAVAQGGSACKRVTVPGEVKYGEGFEQAIGSGLKVYLQPVKAGWILRVRPVGGPALEHDYAELATPPYNSVTPLSISTDFSFRAQDAVGWNPRAFRFAQDKAAYERLSTAYTKMMAAGTNPPPAAQVELAKLVTQAYAGTFRILDAKLVPGTADQWIQAGAVASHFTTTAHRLEQPADGKDSPLGTLMWLRFELQLDVPAGFATAVDLKTEAKVCAVR